jgi:protein-S-isoprenylcysteine O-methyltransferase Ste14
MTDLFIQWGNFLFHTRNVLFPILTILLLVIFPPVPMADAAGQLFLWLGFVILAVGETLRILTIGLAYIIRGGRQRRIYAEKLVTDGMFSHSRNPLYLGNILYTSSFFFIAGNPWGILIGSSMFAIIYRLIVCSEEDFLGNLFGQAYQDFCHDVPRWFPRLTGITETIASYKFDWQGVIVKEHGTIVVALLTPLAIISWKLHLVGRLAENATLMIGLAVLVLAVYSTTRFLKKTRRLQSSR